MSIFEKIVNPETGRKVSIYSHKGRYILNNYIQLGGAIMNANYSPDDDNLDQRIENITSEVLFTRIGHAGELKTLLEWEISKDIRFYNDPEEEFHNDDGILINENQLIDHILDGWDSMYMTPEFSAMSQENKKENISVRLGNEGLRPILTERYIQNTKAYVESIVEYYDNNNDAIGIMVIDICNDLFGPGRFNINPEPVGVDQIFGGTRKKDIN